MASSKRFRVKIFSAAGVYFADFPIVMNGFRKIINGGLGDLTIKIPLRFEEAYQKAALQLMYRVEIYTDNYLLYSGFIAGIKPRISYDTNEVNLICRGHAARFSFLPLKNSTTVRLYTDTSTGLKTSASESASSLEVIMKAIIDRYNAEAVFPIINYNSTSVINSGIVLADDFNDNNTDRTKWTQANAGVVAINETNGQLLITATPSTAGSNYGGYNSKTGNVYSLIGGSFTIEVPQVTNTATNALTQVNVTYDSSNFIGFQQKGGTLYAFKVVAGVTTNVSTAAYNATNHRWWRIRESGGTTYWDTSTDGLTWTNFTSTANPITLTIVKYAYFAGTLASIASPGAAIFDNVSITASLPAWTYIFQTKSIQYAIDKVMENAPANWYWRVGADNVFYFQPRSITPDVILNYKTQINYFEDTQMIDGMVNRSYFAYNGSPPANAKLTSDTTSSSNYGDWWHWQTDGRYADDTQVNNVSQAIIDAKKTPVRRTVIEVPDSNHDKTTGYDIELLEPGQTVRITNLPEATSAVLPSLFIIVAVDYAPDKALLELETYVDDIAREIAKKEMRDDAASMDNAPATYS